MTNLRYIILLTAMLVILLFSGCEQDLNLNDYRNSDIENMLVVNSILNPDSLIGVSVTHPYFFSDKHVTFKPITNLNVQVAGESGEWEKLLYNGDSGLYLSKQKPIEGELYKINIIESSDTVYSYDVIPRKVAIEKVEATGEGPMHIFWDTDYRFTYKITFQDTPDTENFYFLAIEDDALVDEFSQMGQVDYTADYVFQVLANTINQDIQGWQPDGVFGYPFSDKGIEGELYTITVSEVLQTPLVGMIKRLPRKIKLYSISKSYFEYMVSVLSMDYDESAFKGNLLSLGLMEPTKIYSNIDGGTGLMGSYNLSIVNIDLLQLAGGWPSK